MDQHVNYCIVILGKRFEMDSVLTAVSDFIISVLAFEHINTSLVHAK